MKVFKIILICLLLTACSQANPMLDESMMRSRIVRIESIAPIGNEGKWVILSRHQILTSRHVVERCARWRVMSQSWSSRLPCRVLTNGQKYLIQEIYFPDPARDTALLAVDIEKEYSQIPEVSENELVVWEPVLIFTQTGRIQGRILGLSQNYLWYGTMLSGKLLSWTVVTDIIVDHGESGTPIWTFSGELIGIMSAVNQVEGKSYGVR